MNVETTLLMRSAFSATSAANLILSTPAQSMQGWFASVNGGNGVVIQNTPTPTVVQTLVLAPSPPPPWLPPDQRNVAAPASSGSDAPLTFRGSALSIATDIAFLLLGVMAAIASVLALARVVRCHWRRSREARQLVVTQQAKEQARTEARAEARDELQATLRSLRASPSTGPDPSLCFRSLSTPSSANSSHMQEEGRTLANVAQGMLRVQRSAVETWMPALAGADIHQGSLVAGMPPLPEQEAAGRMSNTPRQDGGTAQAFELELAEWLAQPYCSDAVENAPLPPLAQLGSARSISVERSTSSHAPPIDHHRTQHNAFTYFV